MPGLAVQCTRDSKMQTADRVRIVSVLNLFKRNAEVDTQVRIRCVDEAIFFFRPDLDCYVMTPLVLNVTCKSRIWTNVLLVHMQELQLLLWSILSLVYTKRSLCFSASPKRMQWEQTRL